MSRDAPVLNLADLLAPEECAREIARASGLGFVSQQFRGQERMEVRNRVSVDDQDAADRLWSKLAPRLPALALLYGDALRPDPDVADLANFAPSGLNPRLRYYKYSAGERFAPHVDLAHSEGDVRSFLTVIVYLNDDFQGGETDFFGHSFAPRRGAAIVFPHELPHEGR